MLTRIRIQGFKSFDDVEVKLSPLTVLLGPNAAGKSNFLDALQLLSRLAISASVAGAFTPPYRGMPLESFSFGPEGVQGLLTPAPVSLRMEADVKLSQIVIEDTARQARELLGVMRGSLSPAGLKWADELSEQGVIIEKHLRYSFRLEMLPRRGIIGILDERIEALTPEGNVKPLEESSLTESEKSFNPRQIHDKTLKSLVSIPLAHTTYPHFRALQQELASWSFFYFEPRERMRESNPVRETRHIGMMGENLASFLNTLQALDSTQYDAIERAMRLLVPSFSGLKVEVNERGEVVLYLFEDGKPIPASLLSEGTLRLLGLFALGGAKERPTLIGFEEPENGVHPRRIRLIAELLKSYVASGDTQMIVTTHSPVLLDALPRESLYVCRKIRGRTRIIRAIDLDPIGLERDMDASFAEESELAMSERMLRGDFDA